MVANGDAFLHGEQSPFIMASRQYITHFVGKVPKSSIMDYKLISGGLLCLSHGGYWLFRF